MFETAVVAGKSRYPLPKDFIKIPQVKVNGVSVSFLIIKVGKERFLEIEEIPTGDHSNTIKIFVDYSEKDHNRLQKNTYLN